jgi:hypothetical protein
MAQEHGGILHVARHHLGWEALCGLLLAVCGVAPGDQFRELFEWLGVREYFVHVWPQGWNPRLLPVGIALLIVAGGIFSRHRRRPSEDKETPPAAAPVAVQVVNIISGRSPDRERSNGSEKSKPTPPVLPRSIEGLFTGREDLLQRLHAALMRAHGGQSAIAALHGLGGIGKTRVAVEYAWAQREQYSAVLFALGDTLESLRRNLAGLSKPLALPQREAAEEAVQLQAVLDWLQADSNAGWLLILDNVDTRPALAEALRLTGGLIGGHVLMTSRLDNFPPHVEAVRVDLLSPAAAEAFLLQRTPRRRRAADDAARTRELAEELGWLALALEHAGAYIDTRQIGFAEYLDIWQNSRDKVIGWADPTITGYERSIAETWQVSVDQLSDAGRHLLQPLAFLAPDPVPEFLLDVAVPGAEGEDLREASANLAAYSLVTRDVGKRQFSVHRLVQDATRRSLDPPTSRQRLTEALNWVNAAFVATRRMCAAGPASMRSPHMQRALPNAPTEQGSLIRQPG